MAQQMMIQAPAKAAGRNAAYNRQQAMQVWGATRPVTGRAAVRREYIARRQQYGRSLARHALGTLLVLGALALMANV